MGLARGNRAGHIFGLAATYIGTVIGAGFASGQEIWVFFGRHGRAGFIGLTLASMLFFLAGGRALALGARARPGETYYEVMHGLFGRMTPVLDFVLILFFCVLSGVMLAGTGALAASLGGSPWLGMAVTAFLGILIIAADIPGVVIMNKFVVPLLVLMVGIVAFRTLQQVPVRHLSTAGGHWLYSSLLYASYNIVLSMPILVALGAAERDPAIRRRGCAWASVGLGLIGLLILSALVAAFDPACGVEVPMAALASGMGKATGLAYSVALWAEMFTTLVAECYGASVRLCQLFGGRRDVWAAAVMISGMVLSRYGFANLIVRAYPVMGLLCLAVLIKLLWARVDDRK